MAVDKVALPFGSEVVYPTWLTALYQSREQWSTQQTWVLLLSVFVTFLCFHDNFVEILRLCFTACQAIASAFLCVQWLSLKKTPKNKAIDSTDKMRVDFSTDDYQSCHCNNLIPYSIECPQQRSLFPFWLKSWHYKTGLINIPIPLGQNRYRCVYITSI